MPDAVTDLDEARKRLDAALAWLDHLDAGECTDHEAHAAVRGLLAAALNQPKEDA
jgi:hypothetical protein